VAAPALNNAVCNSNHIASGASLIFNKLRRTWKEGGVVEFHVQPRDLPGGAEKNKKKVCLAIQSTAWDLNPKPSKRAA